LALLPLSSLAPTRALAARGAPVAVASAPARSRRTDRERRGAPRRARLPRVHADPDRARGVRPDDPERPLDRARRERDRVRDHRRLVPSAYGAHARRDDARGAEARAAPRRPPADGG